MPDHVSAPALTPSAPLGDAPGVDPTALPPVTGNGPQPPSTADAFGATGSAPNVMDEPRESAGAVPASGEALGRPDHGRSLRQRGQRPRHRRADHELRGFLGAARAREAPAVWLADEFGRYPDLWTGGAGTDAPRDIKDIVDSGHVDRIIGSSGAESLQGGAGNGPMYPS